MLATYYNYREISYEEAEQLYPDWNVGVSCEITEDGVVEQPDRFAFGRPVRRVHRSHNLRNFKVSLHGQLLISMNRFHWYEYERPLSKLQRGPFAKADVTENKEDELSKMTHALLAGRAQVRDGVYADPQSFLPVKLWVADFTVLSHFVETYPYEATHVLYYYPQELEFGTYIPLEDVFGAGVLACYVCEEASFVLAEIDRPATADNDKALAATNFRVQMTKAEAAFQRQVGPTCPSTTMARLYGAFEHGLIPDDLRSDFGYLE